MLPIVIPFHKNKEQLDKCVAALHAAKEMDIQVINDTESSAGFTATVNRGMRLVIKTKSKKPYVLVLNQDCYLKADAVEKMITFMDAHPRCAIAGIKQLSSQNPDHIIHGGTLECFPAGRHEGGLVSRGDCNVSKQVPWVNGACMIVRLEAVLDFGLMDENMKMFGSDADWSYTARARGWETWYIANAECIHEQGVSKSRTSDMEKMFEKDMLYFRSKWIDGELFRDLSLEIFPLES